jgi:hypothetical protein
MRDDLALLTLGTTKYKHLVGGPAATILAAGNEPLVKCFGSEVSSLNDLNEPVCRSPQA